MNQDEIDIKHIIQNRLGSKARWIPGFVYSGLRKLIHEDFLNEFIRRGHVGVDFCLGTIDYLGVKLTVEGLEDLPKDLPPSTFVCNHPLGAIDGVTLGGLVGQRYDGRIKYLVNEWLMNLKGLAPLCVPVSVSGHQNRDLPARIDEAFKSENHILMFPARLCSRLNDEGQIHDLPWNKAFLQKSLQTKRDIIPVHFIAQNSKRFYRVARWCKRLHLKVNLAMALLPDEMYRSRGSSFTIRFGKPIPYQHFDNSRTAAQWALWVEDEVYKL